MLQLPEGYYWKILKTNNMAEKCNCSHRSSVSTGLSLTGKLVFFYDLSESES